VLTCPLSHTACSWVLIENALADHLAKLMLPEVAIITATLFDPSSGTEWRTHKQLCIGWQFTEEDIADLAVSEERMLLMDERHVFVSASLKRRLEAGCFKYLQFIPGLEAFPSSRIQWTKSGENILDPVQLAAIKHYLDEVGYIVVSWSHWRGASAPTPLAFDDYETFMEFLKAEPKVGDIVDVWPFPTDLALRIAGGKIPTGVARFPSVVRTRSAADSITWVRGLHQASCT
jgi:hypothetical protein